MTKFYHVLGEVIQMHLQSRLSRADSCLPGACKSFWTGPNNLFARLPSYKIED